MIWKAWHCITVVMLSGHCCLPPPLLLSFHFCKSDRVFFLVVMGFLPYQHIPLHSHTELFWTAVEMCWREFLWIIIIITVKWHEDEFFEKQFTSVSGREVGHERWGNAEETENQQRTISLSFFSGSVEWNIRVFQCEIWWPKLASMFWGFAVCSEYMWWD